LYKLDKTTKTVIDKEKEEGRRLMEAKYTGLTANFASIVLYASKLNPYKIIH
jgi:hypothetical protein